MTVEREWVEAVSTKSTHVSTLETYIMYIYIIYKINGVCVSLSFLGMSFNIGQLILFLPILANVGNIGNDC